MPNCAVLCAPKTHFRVKVRTKCFFYHYYEQFHETAIMRAYNRRIPVQSYKFNVGVCFLRVLQSNSREGRDWILNGFFCPL